MGSSNSDRWGIVLAGGDGSRLKSFTRRIAGFDLPKQFCPILSSKPLLEETLARIDPAISPSQTLVSLNRQHRRFYSPMFREAPQILIEAPGNRGTAPAILHAAMRIYERSPSAIVGLFPSDHYVGNESRFIEHLATAFDTASDHDDTMVLLGAQATGAEQSYGWIVPEASTASAASNIKSVQRFVEKPDARLANELWRAGALWNTMMMVGQASVFLRFFRTTMPYLYACFASAGAGLDTGVETEAMERLYRDIATSNFSEVVLQQAAAYLLVMPMSDVEWCDLGEPVRVMEVARQMGVSLKWAVA
jgi:mannose-1-phosphate guanylyltransferase